METEAKVINCPAASATKEIYNIRLKYGAEQKNGVHNGKPLFRGAARESVTIREKENKVKRAIL